MKKTFRRARWGLSTSTQDDLGCHIRRFGSYFKLNTISDEESLIHHEKSCALASSLWQQSRDQSRDQRRTWRMGPRAQCEGSPHGPGKTCVASGMEKDAVRRDSL